MKGHPNSTHDIDFSHFVREAMKGKPQGFANVGSPARFLRGGIGTGGVTHLYQYEQFELAFDFLSNRLKHDIQPQKTNVSPPAELTLSDDIRAKYREKRAEEFDLWRGAHR